MRSKVIGWRNPWVIAACVAVVVLAGSGFAFAVAHSSTRPVTPPAPAGGNAGATATVPGALGPSQAGAAGSRPANTASQRPTKNVIIGWIQEYTPTGGGQGGKDSAYFAFTKRDCAGTLEIARSTSTADGNEPLEDPYRSLFEGAAAACLAAFSGRVDLWATATARYAAVDPEALACWDREVYGVWRKLVEAYRADPRTTFSRGPAAGTGGCPELTGFEPDHGARDGGYSITVAGRNLPPRLDLIWLESDLTVPAVRRRDGRMALTVPRAKSNLSTDVLVMIAGAPRIADAIVTFRYDDGH
jgi:hypothetical protein